jgi:glycosyltransferase involved in cell wall biosynthesis
MRIALILRKPPFPAHTGFNLIVHNVIKRLAELHQIRTFFLDAACEEGNFHFYTEYELYECDGEVLNNYNGAKISRFARYYGTEENKLAWLQRKVSQFNPERLLGFGYDLLGYFGALNTSIPKILDIVDSETLYLWREIKTGSADLNNWKHLLAAVMISRKYVKNCEAIITVGIEDSENIRKLTGYENVYTVPNGVDHGFYCPNGEVQKVDGQVVFSGSLSFSPNQRAIQWFVKNCWKDIIREIPDAKLIVIGKDPKKELKDSLESSYENVKVIGFVEDIRDYVRMSQVSIAPMVSGSGIKNKILEAWALGQAVVSTSLGARGLVCEDEKDILLADNPGHFSRQVIRLINDKNMRERLGDAARKNVVRNYSWQSISNEFNRLITLNLSDIKTTSRVNTVSY